MRRILLVVLSLATLALCNLAILRNERLLASGETLFLELAPADPRSLIQGDYMRLRYAIEQQAQPAAAARGQRRGHLVVALDAAHVGTFVRLHAGEPLGPGERLLSYRLERQRVRIDPDSFLFQEGLADRYRAAKFGEFKLDGAGGRLLVGLTDGERRRIEAGSAVTP